MTKDVLELIFLDAANKTVRISVPNAKTPIDQTAVNAAMDMIVQKNIFSFGGSDIVKKVEARLNESSITSYPAQ